MINAANAAGVLFAFWVAFSFGLAPFIGKMMADRRRVKVRVVAVRSTIAKPVAVRRIRAHGYSLPRMQAA